MKITNLNLMCLCIFLTSMLCSAGCSSVKAFQTNTSSPSGTYTVKFFEHTESQRGLMFDNRVVTFSLLKYSNVVFDQELFSREKADKPSFAQKYPRQDWKSENILRLGGDSLPDSNCDEITVSNLTAKEITYFDVITFLPERFIIFDLYPNSTVKLYAKPENDVAISSEAFILSGKFSNGYEIKRKEVTFKLRRDTVATAHFCILITDEGISMTSSEYEGTTYDFTETVKGLKEADPATFSPESIPKPKEIFVHKQECKAR